MGKETKKMLETIMIYQEKIMKHLSIEHSETKSEKSNGESKKKSKPSSKAKVRKMVRP